MMASRTKRPNRASRQAAVVIELLDPRTILDAPLALASNGLILSGPDSLEQREPALFSDAAPASPAGSDAPALAQPIALPQPLDPKDDPLSPVGDPAVGQR